MICVENKFIKVSDYFSLPCARVVGVIDTSTTQGEALYKEKKADKTLINTTGKDKVRSLIILDNGSCVASPWTVDEITDAVNNE